MASPFGALSQLGLAEGEARFGRGEVSGAEQQQSHELGTTLTSNLLETTSNAKISTPMFLSLDNPDWAYPLIGPPPPLQSRCQPASRPGTSFHYLVVSVSYGCAAGPFGGSRPRARLAIL